jgi:hypothetical protein
MIDFLLLDVLFVLSEFGVLGDFDGTAGQYLSIIINPRRN